MFETSQVHARALSSARHARFFTASIAVHSLAIVGAVIASVASIDFPSHAPDQLAALQLVARVDLPPAGPRAAAPSRPQAATQPPRQQTAPVAPESIPDEVTPLENSGAVNSDTLAGDEGRAAGEKDGVTDGIPGGIPEEGNGVTTGTPVHEGPLVVGGEVLAPRVLTRVTPEFPAIAARAGMKGVVVVECIIDRQGNVRDARVLHSPFSAFEHSALSAVRQWKFAPGTYRGNPVATIFNLTVTFSVTNAR